MHQMIKYFMTYEFEGTPMTVRQWASDDKDALEVARKTSKKKKMKLLRVSRHSPKPRYYTSSLSSIATSTRLVRSASPGRQARNG